MTTRSISSAPQNSQGYGPYQKSESWQVHHKQDEVAYTEGNHHKFRAKSTLEEKETGSD